MDELKNIEYAFKMFDLKTKALIYGFQKEVENGKDFKGLCKTQTNRDFNCSLREQNNL